jgi:hypothetical protein
MLGFLGASSSSFFDKPLFLALCIALAAGSAVFFGDDRRHIRRWARGGVALGAAGAAGVASTMWIGGTKVITVLMVLAGVGALAWIFTHSRGAD